jgi:type II secretory pathway component PulF
LFPVSIQAQTPGAEKKSALKKINSSDITIFTRQLANLIHSGFNISAALLTLSLQAQNMSLRKLIQDLHEKIKKGEEFSKSLSGFPKVFPAFYVSMIRIGETSGRMDETLTRLADFKEKEFELVSQVKSALTYPAFLVIVGTIIIFVLITFYVPRLVTMFSDFGQALPLPTKILLQTSIFMNKFWWVFACGLGILLISGKSYYKNERGRLAFDKLALNLPVAKDLIQKVEISRFSYALAVLLKNGVPILESLEVVTLSVDNRYLRNKISSFQDEIRKGKSLSSCLKSDRLFPVMLTNMVAVGEESGELPEMLFRIAQVFEADVNRAVKSAVSLIEPALILFIGGAVIAMVFSILLPIFQLEFITK